MNPASVVTVSAGAIGICLLFPSLGLASPVTYTETATISGTLNGVSFSGDVLTLTGSGDTANVTQSGTLFLNPLTVSFNISGGVGSGTFTNASAADSQTASGGSAGFTDTVQSPPTGLAILLTAGTGTYDLKSTFGPVSGTAIFNAGPLFGYPTTDGRLTITSVTDNATFSADVVPLPAALPLFATGIGALSLLGWRRKRKARAVA